jgi:hypothetical protein
VVYFAEKPLFDDKACQSKWNTSSTRHPAGVRISTKKIYETQKLTLNLQARKVRPEGLQGDLGHDDVRRAIKVDELDTSRSQSTADTQTSV